MYKDGDYEAILDKIEPIAGECDFSTIRERGMYLTMTKEGVPIGCGGVIMTSDTEGELWIKISRFMCQKPVTLMRVLKAGLEIIEKSFELDRITARVFEGFDSGSRLVSVLGFNSTSEIVDKYRIYEKWLTR